MEMSETPLGDRAAVAPGPFDGWRGAGIVACDALELVTKVGAIARDLPATGALEPIARALLPFLGDTCAIDLEKDADGLGRFLVVHVDAATEPSLRREMRAAFDASRDHGAIRAWAAHAVALRPNVAAPEEATALAVDPGALSVLIVPLLARGEAFGSLTLVSHDDRRRHGECDVVLAQEVAERIAMSLEIQRLEALAERAQREAGEAIDHTRRLEAVTAALSNALTCTEAADLISRQVVEGVGATSAAVARLGEGDVLEIVAARGVPPEFLGDVRLDAAMPAVDALRTMGPIFIESIADREAHYPHLASLHVGTGNGAFAAIPLTGTRGVFGVMGLTFREARVFGTEDRAFLMALAYHCAQALERARLYDVEHAARVNAESARRRAEFFVAVGLVLSGSLEEAGMAAAVAQLAATYIARWCVIDLVDATGKRQHAAVAHPEVAEASRVERLATLCPSANAGDPLSIVTRTRCELVVSRPDVAAWPGISDEERTIWRTLGLDWVGCFPLIARGRTMGALLVGGCHESAATSDPALGRELANQLAIALDRARLFEAARAAVRAREEMVAIVSHDLRTPLFVISANAQFLLRARNPTTEDVTRTSEATQRAVARMNALVSDILDGERIAGGQWNLDLHSHEVYAIIEEAMEPFRVRAHDQGVALEIAVQDGTGAIPCDRARLTQVLCNLLDNAFKFSAKGGRIRVAAARRDGEVRFDVSDTGEGIAPGALPHVFERYWRGSGSGRSAIGLGLAIVKGIVDAHGGTVGVESERGVGTTFHFTLPAAISASPGLAH